MHGCGDGCPRPLAARTTRYMYTPSLWETPYEYTAYTMHGFLSLLRWAGYILQGPSPSCWVQGGQRRSHRVDRHPLNDKLVVVPAPELPLGTPVLYSCTVLYACTACLAGRAVYASVHGASLWNIKAILSGLCLCKGDAKVGPDWSSPPIINYG